ncbi:MAG: CTP synthase [Chloroflexi bacterium HGW-Chloroflexi-10]|nr:MAG: CTP synthase [Chloroflexi bacterium HGW-Chloroflexi-10]
MPTKYIFFTGGVVSSVGKGVTAAAIGRLLKERGFRVAVQKLDPYINVDPGTMSPYQHGEVFVTDDGAETDLDLGHYERFIDIRLNKACNMTTGQVYAEVISKERRGDYLGGTIQVIPHITNEIKRRIMLVSKTTDAEIVLIEVGGTVGDIESQPFLETIRQLRSDLGKENTVYIHVTWIPSIGATGELKTKPTQHSVRELRSIGITPDMIIARSDLPIPEDLCEKISLFCDVERNAVVPMTTAKNLYEVPLLLEDAQVGEYLTKRLVLNARQTPDWTDWRKMINTFYQDRQKVKIALVGKYVELHDAYMSVRESLNHAALSLNLDLDIDWIHSADLEKGKSFNLLEEADGILVPGGFGSRGIEGKINAARFARTNKKPYLGLCLGMQLMVVEFGRYVFNDESVNSTEFDRTTTHPVIDLMPDQQHITDLGGTMRLGLYPCDLKPGSKAALAYQQERVEERHRHRFEFNNKFRSIFEENGMIFSGLSPDGKLVEIAEIKDHPFMLATQFHPEFLSRPNRAHPLFVAFVCAAWENAQNNKI